MKKTIVMLVLAVLINQNAQAAVREFVYDGNELYIKTKKDHTTTLIFPESIKGVVRGYGADAYVIQRRASNNKILEIMPVGEESAELSVSGVSGEEYILRMLRGDDFDTKVEILHLTQAIKNVDILTKNLINKTSESTIKIDEKRIDVKKDILPEAVVDNKTASLPQQQPQQQPQEKPTEQTPQVESNNGGTDSHLPAELNYKVTLRGTDLPLRVYLGVIGKATGYNVIATPEVSDKKASINLENIEVWRALKSLLYPFSYGFKVSKEDLIIATVETRIFEIAIPAIEQNFSDVTSNESFTQNQQNGSSSGTQGISQEIKVGTKIMLENKSPVLSLWGDLEQNIKSMITPLTGNYSINKVSGTIVVTDLPGVLDRVGEFVTTINSQLRKQQAFEIQIIEVTLTDKYEMGIDWGAVAKNISGMASLSAASNLASSGFAGGQMFQLAASNQKGGIGSSDSGVSMMVRALEEMGHVEVVSKPTISVTNMIPCIIQKGTSKTYISGSGQTVSSNSTSTNLTTSQVSEGLTMRIVAKIGDKQTDSVLNLSAAITSIDSIDNINSGNVTIQTPQVSTKSITTNIGVREGQTIIIGGLISSISKDGNTGVPGISRVPILGKAFKYRNKLGTKSELVIAITPKGVLKN